MNRYTIFLCLSLLAIATVYANEPHEIELKFKVPSEQSTQFKQLITSHTVAPVIMDELYVMGSEIQPTDIDGYKKMGQYLRIRKTPKGSFITLKKRANGTVVEYETKIEDSAMMRQILQTLGYGSSPEYCVHLIKQREKYMVRFKEYDIEVVFDTFNTPAHMQAMGQFIETELKSIVSSYDQGVRILQDFLRCNGITQIAIYPPYVELALNTEYAKHIRHMNLQ